MQTNLKASGTSVTSTRNFLARFFFSLFVFLGVSTATGNPVVAQENDAASAAAQANNPLANFKAVNVQNYYIGDISGTDQTGNQFWLRYAQPLSLGNTNWVLRASLPLNSFPAQSGKTTGVGDLNVFAAYLIDIGNPAVSFGVGPQLTAPTGSTDGSGSKKWSAGIANVLFNASSPIFQYGYLLTWQASFAGDSDAKDVNIGAFQPFLFYQLGGGTYLRSAPIMTYDFESDSYNVPIGLGIGKVFKKKDITYNVFVEPQYSVASKGPGQAKWQIFAGFNTQF
ncbi:hypothetical protein RUE5091_04279 [Ruegeria denitrificans]|uniref:Protein involved in meta-pathway of phenol degradation n=1 Tax=Ruegeria denitrificans TaxID=1715692 RepID=A0A0P1IK71_9RHOB|nr:hypothetical protein [Ruegeria denitrificans]CUK18593.1 hypothetical protein RUE5091_04279 [Ruegeria denitrificans]